MSSEGAAGEDFDFAEPVLGFRLWALGDDARLRGVAYDQLWERGENLATCGAAKPHATAPVAGCRCGFNALHDLPPQAWRYGPGYVAGAIAAWGEIEWHRTGFRAEKACVIGLCFDPRDNARARQAIEAAGLRYGVEIVPRRDLLEHSIRFARPLAPAALRRQPATVAPRRDSDADPRSIARSGSRGYWIGRHVVVERGGSDLSIGIAPALARRIGAGARLISLATGAEVARGETVAVLHTGAGSFSIDAPLAGTLSSANEAVLQEPPLAAADLSEGGWVVRLRAAGKIRAEDSPLIWGRRGRESYERYIARVGPDRMLEEVALKHRLGCTRVGCAGDAVSLTRERLRREAARANARLQAA